MTVIVSANYRDRDQKNWLVRNRNEPIEKYDLRGQVVIKGFRFCPSFDGEEGFGCRTVAIGELEESEIARDKLVRIRFNGLDFVTEEGNSVSHGRALVLDETGMYYLPA